jgi:hypothetical protein
VAEASSFGEKKDGKLEACPTLEDDTQDTSHTGGRLYLLVADGGYPPPP